MISVTPTLSVRLARDASDRAEAERLRYDVFVRELGGDGALVDHAAGRERDRFDAVADQLLLIDEARPEGARVVGLYRLLDTAGAARMGQFYTEDEFDLDPLRSTGRGLLELGRSCLHRDYRGGTAMFRLWQGLAALVEARGIEILFGTASFQGADPAAHAGPLALLARDHLAPPELRVTSRQPDHVSMPGSSGIDRVGAMRAMPPLIKAYLRLGGRVGQGVFADTAFNTTDVCMILDTATAPAGPRARYGARG
ncbi:GNAT family N-acetyltransferase [Limimaricola hongkongensis]|uniref:L-ornithine N(alpha)-acyltransferase n=1 Tax=Limimaricola hongkongensis DSM 17492 TaxID=1122180 RepID=A0A017HD48_9RHOB|nr:GNAT family N-acyltransferase [Limimaricola hongkongensis]EYD71719.1 hypothetical protein Lokhon_01789 [Limimaricola hongkongensis DSM 17492]